MRGQCRQKRELRPRRLCFGRSCADKFPPICIALVRIVAIAVVVKPRIASKAVVRCSHIQRAIIPRARLALKLTKREPVGPCSPKIDLNHAGVLQLVRNCCKIFLVTRLRPTPDSYSSCSTINATIWLPHQSIRFCAEAPTACPFKAYLDGSH
jgi:hypothetical protein